MFDHGFPWGCTVHILLRVCLVQKKKKKVCQQGTMKHGDGSEEIWQCAVGRVRCRVTPNPANTVAGSSLSDVREKMFLPGPFRTSGKHLSKPVSLPDPPHPTSKCFPFRWLQLLSPQSLLRSPVLVLYLFIQTK